jgi:hypothetical protein
MEGSVRPLSRSEPSPTMARMNGQAPHHRPRQGQDRYERWIGGAFRGESPTNRPFLPARLSYIAAVSMVTWIVVVAGSPLAPAIRGPAALGLVATGLAGAFVWLRSWSVALERTHVRLLARPDLGDGRRIALFFGAHIGYGLASLTIGGVLLWLVGGRTPT